MSTTELHWGCPKCGGTDGKVLAVERDADMVPIRRRRCVAPGCGGIWLSEERALDPASWWLRAESLAVRERSKRRQEIHKCRVCAGTYVGGHYLLHVKRPRHKAAIGPTAERWAEIKAYRAEWARQRRAKDREEHRRSYSRERKRTAA